MSGVGGKADRPWAAISLSIWPLPRAKHAWLSRALNVCCMFSGSFQTLWDKQAARMNVSARRDHKGGGNVDRSRRFAVYRGQTAR